MGIRKTEFFFVLAKKKYNFNLYRRPIETIGGPCVQAAVTITGNAKLKINIKIRSPASTP
jgi:hypothetical protein